MSKWPLVVWVCVGTAALASAGALVASAKDATPSILRDVSGRDATPMILLCSLAIFVVASVALALKRRYRQSFATAMLGCALLGASSIPCYGTHSVPGKNGFESHSHMAWDLSHIH